LRLQIAGIQVQGTRKERQLRNFLEAIRELECDQTGQHFKQTLAQLLPVKRGLKVENARNTAAPVADLRSAPPAGTRSSPVQLAKSPGWCSLGGSSGPCRPPPESQTRNQNEAPLP
jgi:hypothetical protein